MKKQKFGEKKMKKTAIAAVILLALAGAAFCEKQEIPVDVYDDGTEQAQEQKDAIKKKKEKEEEKAQKETKIKWNTKANK